MAKKRSKKKSSVLLPLILFIILSSIFMGLLLDLIAPKTIEKSIIGSPTGRVVESTVSRVSVMKFLALAKSTDLAGGIDFGTIPALPTAKAEASSNYDDINDQTGYYISVHSDSNTNVDFCVTATPLRTQQLDEIPLDNYYWSNSTSNDLTYPEQFGRPMLDSYFQSILSVVPGDDVYYRFWLDIGASQASGSYENTVSFQGVPAGEPCV